MVYRTKKIKWALTAALGLSIIAVVWIFCQFRQGQSSLQIPLSPEQATKAIMALSRVHQTATKDGIVQWELDADTARLEADTGKMVLQSPQVDFFLDDGTRVHLTAQEGVLYTRNNNMEVRGNVQLHNDRYSLKTEVLAYEHDHRVMRTDAPVHITGQAIELKAATMHYDLKTNQALFSGPVEGLLYEKPAI
jgi:LPS export ABC transporter protein LptC